MSRPWPRERKDTEDGDTVPLLEHVTNDKDEDEIRTPTNNRQYVASSEKDIESNSSSVHIDINGDKFMPPPIRSHSYPKQNRFPPHLQRGNFSQHLPYAPFRFPSSSEQALLSPAV